MVYLVLINTKAAINLLTVVYHMFITCFANVYYMFITCFANVYHMFITCFANQLLLIWIVIAKAGGVVKVPKGIYPQIYYYFGIPTTRLAEFSFCQSAGFAPTALLRKNCLDLPQVS